MRAAVLRSPGDLSIVEVPTPEIGDGEILVKVAATTLCGSDVRIYLGQKTGGVRWPAVIGHEFSGIVAAVGDGAPDLLGRTVSVIPWIACGACPSCVAGRRNLCDDLRVLGYGEHGSLAEYVRVPADAVESGCVVPVEADVPATHLALAEPLACALHGHRRSDIRLGQSVLIVGGGPIGLFHLQLAVLAGAEKVIVSEPGELRREVATRFGATAVVDPSQEDLREIVMRETGGTGVDHTIVCIGYGELVDDVVACTRKAGRVNLFAGFGGSGSAEINLNAIHYGEYDVIGNVGGTRRDFTDALALITSGRIRAAEMITREFSLEDATEAMAEAVGGGALKVAVTS
ncbi:zinc-binding dehydrogenase [Pseudactinotalea sp.]|uniref:zinc-binding dehydrogenase n=1 Tax=Pseudactinotalea sp. TaxID=1926260 RepID=UPI003B3ADDCB